MTKWFVGWYRTYMINRERRILLSMIGMVENVVGHGIVDPRAQTVERAIEEFKLGKGWD